MLKKLLIKFPKYAAIPVAGVVLWLYALHTAGSELHAVAAVRFVLLLQVAVMGLFAPFFYFASGHSRPIKNAAAALCRSCGIIASFSVLACGIAVAGGIGIPWASMLKAAAIAAGFAVLLIGVSASGGRIFRSAPAGLLAGYVVAALMLGTVFYANPAVSAAHGAAKVPVVQAAVVLNPLIVTAGSAVSYDIMLFSLYDTSLIGPDHVYRYPGWWLPVLAYLFAGALLAIAALAKGSRICRKTGGSE